MEKDTSFGSLYAINVFLFAIMVVLSLTLGVLIGIRSELKDIKTAIEERK